MIWWKNCQNWEVSREKMIHNFQSISTASREQSSLRQSNIHMILEGIPALQELLAL